MLKHAVLALSLAHIPLTASAQAILTIYDSENAVLQEYTLDELDSLDQTAYLTGNSFIDDESEFSGPSMRLILDQAGVDLTDDGTVLVSAINDYQIEVPMSDIIAYDVMLATRRDGEEMSIREKGPIWLMYPIADFEELSDPIYDSRLIWQVDSVQLTE